MPDVLTDRSFTLEGSVAADVADAEAAIIALNNKAVALADFEVLPRLLLRAESVASSKIEGLEIGPRRLLRAEAAIRIGETPRDRTAIEVLANIDAMVYAVGRAGSDRAINLGDLLEIHRRMFASGRLASFGGTIRRQQNWIGGSDFNPCSAAFVPPPPEAVPLLLADLIQFCTREDLPAIVQAAVAHAQFETIHPFVDGNGRVGRALIHLVLRRRGLTPYVLPPVSLILATWPRAYIDGLNATRYRGPASSVTANRGTNLWVGTFAAAARRSAVEALAFQERIRSIRSQWRERLGPVRAGSATDLLVHVLPGAPIVTVSSAAGLVARTVQATNSAITRLIAAGVLKQVTVGRRNRAFEAPDIIGAFGDLERRLTGSANDSSTLGPSMRPPQRS
ncbi:MAG TPA: Fic family protein [Chloroflexota bacterium]|nr:Fic family protein [Chloroflexota bacterium]